MLTTEKFPLIQHMICSKRKWIPRTIMNECLPPKKQFFQHSLKDFCHSELVEQTESAGFEN